MVTAQTLLTQLSSQREALQKFGVSRIGVFGSMARGDSTEKSDVDLLVEFDPAKKTYRNYVGTATFIEELLGRSVDLVTPQALSPYIKPHVLKDIRYVEIAR
jgi:hypothetical protein